MAGGMFVSLDGEQQSIAGRCNHMEQNPGHETMRTFQVWGVLVLSQTVARSNGASSTELYLKRPTLNHLMWSSFPAVIEKGRRPEKATSPSFGYLTRPIWWRTPAASSRRRVTSVKGTNLGKVHLLRQFVSRSDAKSTLLVCHDIWGFEGPPSPDRASGLGNNSPNTGMMH
jgi:hypothetical protein